MTKQRNRHECEFLPAALEIQETPPSPIGRAISISIAALFTITVIWACVGDVDIVAVAQGKIVPSGRTKVIQPLEIGTVRAIHVQEGQRVNKGDLLLELDTTSTEADEHRIDQESQLAKMEQLRTTALIDAIDKKTEAAGLHVSWPQQANKALLVTQRQLLQGQWQEYRARIQAQKNERFRSQAELGATEEVITKLRQTLPLVSERAESLKTLSKQQLAARNTYLELEQQRIEQQQDLAAQEKHAQELRAQIARLEEEQKAYQASFKNDLLGKLADAERRLNGLEQEMVKAKQRTWLQRLSAPVDGVVQQLAVHTIGGVVTPAQQLMVIVPREDGVEVEAVIENRDIGFVFEGQTAEVKVDAFPYTKYGIINAELINVSNDAVHDDNLGLIYTARVLLKQSAIRAGEKLVKLNPGMAVTVEIKTGTRKLIEYIFSPLMEYVSESVRER